MAQITRVTPLFGLWNIEKMIVHYIYTHGFSYLFLAILLYRSGCHSTVFFSSYSATYSLLPFLTVKKLHYFGGFSVFQTFILFSFVIFSLSFSYLNLQTSHVSLHFSNLLHWCFFNMMKRGPEDHPWRQFLSDWNKTIDSHIR